MPLGAPLKGFTPPLHPPDAPQVSLHSFSHANGSPRSTRESNVPVERNHLLLQFPRKLNTPILISIFLVVDLFSPSLEWDCCLTPRVLHMSGFRSICDHPPPSYSPSNVLQKESDFCSPSADLPHSDFLRQSWVRYPFSCWRLHCGVQCQSTVDFLVSSLHFFQSFPPPLLFSLQLSGKDPRSQSAH